MYQRASASIRSHHVTASAPQERAEGWFTTVSGCCLLAVVVIVLGGSWFEQQLCDNDVDASCEAADALATRAEARINSVAVAKGGDLIVCGQESGRLSILSRSASSPPRQVANLRAIRSVAVSPNDRLVAAGGGDRSSREGELRIWKLSTALPHVESLAVPAMVDDLGWSPDADHLAACLEDGAILVWRTADWQLHLELKHSRHLARKVLFLPGGKFIAIGADDGGIYLHRLPGGELQTSWRAHGGPIRSLCCNSDGSYLASAGDEGMVHAWTRTGRLVGKTHGMSGIIRGLFFASDGQSLIVGGGHVACPARFCQVLLRNGVETRALDNPAHSAQCLALDPFGKALISGDADGMVRVWRVHGPRSPEIYNLGP